MSSVEFLFYSYARTCDTTKVLKFSIDFQKKKLTLILNFALGIISIMICHPKNVREPIRERLKIFNAIIHVLKKKKHVHVWVVYLSELL